MFSSPVPAEIPFDQLTAQLAQAATELAAIEDPNAAAPTATFRKGLVSVELVFHRFPGEAFLAALPVLDRYMQSVTELKHAYNGCSLVADVLTARTRSAQPGLPRPLRLTFKFASKTGSGGQIRLDKDSQLCQEEINCALELWRTFLRRPPVEPPKEVAPSVPLLPYDAMVAQLERITGRELANVPAAHLAGGPPTATLQSGKVTVEIVTRLLPEDMLLTVLNLVSNHSRSLSDVQVHATSFSVLVHFRAPGDRLGAKHQALRITLQFDSRRRIRFEKNDLLLQEELLCVLEVWRKVVLRQGEEQPRAGDPGAQLAELGAVVFLPGTHDLVLAGYEATQRDVHETVVLPLLHRDVYVEVAKLTRGQPRPSVPRAVLFEGPPGTGKTTMARRIASDAGLPLVYVPVESVMSKWYGESERRLDAIFDLAGTFDRSIVFLDEIDAFAGSRGATMHEATRRVFSVLLRQLQGLVDTTHVMVIGATNRRVDLDPALLNRFARTVTFPLPNLAERAAIVKRYAQHLDADAVARIAGLVDGASGRELEDLCGTAERLWIGRWLAEQDSAGVVERVGRWVTGAAGISAPPLEVYVEAFRGWNRPER